MPIHTLAPELVQRIALHLLRDYPLGPPQPILPLLLTDRFFYDSLNSNDHPHLYAQIFRRSFDVEAIKRRFPRDQLTAGNLTRELQRRWRCLTRMRRMAASFGWRTYVEADRTEDLTTAFVVLTESDGMNALQLIQWVNLPTWLDKYITTHVVPHHTTPQMPPDSPQTCLAIQLSWMLCDYRSLLSEDPRQTKWITSSFMLGTFAYKNTFAPWTLTSLPVNPPPPIPVSRHPITPNVSPYFISDLTPRTLPQIPVRFDYFGSPLDLAPPLVSHSATLRYFSLVQVRPMFDDSYPYPQDHELIAHFDHFESAHGNFGGCPSVLSRLQNPDDVEFLKGKRNFAPHYVLLRLASLTRSHAWDDDWARLRSCRDPFRMTKELGYPRYRWTRGTLSGEWDGRFMFPDYGTFTKIMEGENALNTLEDAMVANEVQSWTFDEYYHVPASRRSPWAPQRAYGPPLTASDPLRAHLPLSTRVKRAKDGLLVWDSTTPQHDVAFYRKWKEETKGSDEAVQSSASGFWDEDPFLTDDDDYDDEGVIRILIDGYAIPRPSFVPARMPQTAMGPYSAIRGTIRTWDGLITLHSESPGQTDGARWLWTGYIVGDGNFVGRFRDCKYDVQRNGYEGVFVMVKRST
ncbi:hypothetical protein FRB99_007427 [Tulasnella sp. 403]|nr:hypothetical protein FRB99_007427 [Tulasnella sp. 403]